MRPWVLMRQAGIVFEERLVRFDSFDAQSQFKQTLGAVSPVGKVPVLIDDGLVVSDSLAIVEYLAERFPELYLWPLAVHDRARARSACAEMHSGFGALREHLPMNIEASLPEIGERVLRERPDVVADVHRVQSLWCDLLARHNGPMLMGSFSIADAFFAPVVLRFKAYGVPVHPEVARYMDNVLALQGVRDWVDGALREHDFRAFEEPYRSAPPA